MYICVAFFHKYTRLSSSHVSHMKLSYLYIIFLFISAVFIFRYQYVSKNFFLTNQKNSHQSLASLRRLPKSILIIHHYQKTKILSWNSYIPSTEKMCMYTKMDCVNVVYLDLRSLSLSNFFHSILWSLVYQLSIFISMTPSLMISLQQLKLFNFLE